jgi:thiosulfate reductase cytochrome b subunit
MQKPPSGDGKNCLRFIRGHSAMENKVIEIIEKHPRAIRWMHWINFPMIMIMIWSGIQIYWANIAYLPIPKFIENFFDIPSNLANGLGWHFFLMWIFILNGLLFVSYLWITGEWRTLRPGRGAFKDAILVTLHELHLRKTAPHSENKFNAAQRIAYSSVIFMGAGSVITGLAIYKPAQLHLLTTLVGGYEAARLEHFCLMIGFILFFLIHVSEVMRAGWNNFRAMVTGYEIKK